MCNHIKKNYPDLIKERLKRATDGPRKRFQALTCFRKTVSAHVWIDCVTATLQSFSFFSDNVICKHIKHDTICHETFLAYVHKLMCKVEKRIRDTIPDKFVIVFDGPNGGHTRYVEAYATFSADKAVWHEKVLICFQPMEKEEALYAVEHYNYLEYVLEVHGESYDKVEAIVGDSTSTNKAFA